MIIAMLALSISILANIYLLTQNRALKKDIENRRASLDRLLRHRQEIADSWKRALEEERILHEITAKKLEDSVNVGKKKNNGKSRALLDKPTQRPE
jgi:hypothetical protein